MSTTPDIATSAADYAARYLAAFETGALTQGAFHAERGGRQLACALGVIGSDVSSASDCPAQIMPRWLAQMVPAFFDKQKGADAFAWGKVFTAALARVDGKVPFSVIHDWHANAYAYAYAYANADAYADANANANAYAYADANANANANADAWKRLADGMVDALNRVEVVA